MNIENIERLEKFILRARRVESHSLVRSGKARYFASEPMELHNIGSTSCRVLFKYPDEERLESLAARVRPFVLKSESLFFPTIIKALNAELSSSEKTETQIKIIEELQRWSKANCENITDSVSEVSAFGIGDRWVSLPLLAQSWAYIDSVHADPFPEKKVGLQTTYEYRLLAASRYFCQVAVKVLELLELIREIHGAHNLLLSEEVWSKAVVLDEVEGIVGEPSEVSSAIVLLQDSNGNPMEALSAQCYHSGDTCRIIIEGLVSFSLSLADAVPNYEIQGCGGPKDKDPDANKLFDQMKKAGSIKLLYVYAGQLLAPIFRLSAAE